MGYIFEQANTEVIQSSVGVGSADTFQSIMTRNPLRYGFVFSPAFANSSGYLLVCASSIPGGNPSGFGNAASAYPFICHRNIHGIAPSLSWFLGAAGAGANNFLLTTFTYIVDPDGDQPAAQQPQVQQPYVGSGVPNFGPYISQLQAMLDSLRTTVSQGA
jgi:hypothetical protein